MLEIFQKLETITPSMPATVLLWPGIVIALAGLLTWLGGVGHRRVCAAMTTALVVMILVPTGNMADQLPVGVIAAAIAGLAAALLPKVSLSMLAGLIGAAGVLLWSGYATVDLQKPEAPIINTDQETKPAVEALKELDEFRTEVALQLKEDLLGEGSGVWILVSAGATIGVILLAAVMPKLVLPFACSIYGTAMIYLGMIMLLCFKGSAPFTSIAGKPEFFAIIAGVMAGFGALIQFCFCKSKKKKKKEDKDESEEDED